jgi:hypothetical protein
MTKLNEQKGFRLTFKLINPEQQQEPIEGSVLIIVALEPSHEPQFISYPSTTLDNKGIPIRLSKSLRFHILNYKDISGEFDCPFSQVESFNILIYNTDDKLVQKFTILPEEIEET